MERQRIEDSIPKLFKDRRYPGCSDPDFTFRFVNDGFDVEIAQEYEAVNLTFADLKAVSELCQTDKIDVRDGHNRPGCDTCDYGSSYSVVLCVRGVQIEG